MKSLDVALGERGYPIHVGEGLLARAADLLGGIVPRRVVVVTNATVAAHHLAPLRASLSAHGTAVDVLLIPEGEAPKSWPTLQDIITRLLELRAER